MSNCLSKNGKLQGKFICVSELTLDKIIPTKLQIEALYTLLESRQHSISHVDMPSYEEHSSFVMNNPYRCWYLVCRENVVVGSVYVQNDNSVGIAISCTDNCDSMSQVIRLLREAIEPLEAIASLRYKDFFFNVPYDDEERKNCLKQLGYMPTQLSFVLSDQ